MRIWVLTGDKQETAINIGFSCFLITPSTKLIVMRGRTLEQTLEEIQESLTKLIESDDGQEYGLVIDGTTLEFALGDLANKEFYKLGLGCKTVICCRVSPAQKVRIIFYLKC